MSVLLSMDSIIRSGIKPGQATDASEFLSSTGGTVRKVQ